MRLERDFSRFAGFRADNRQTKSVEGISLL